MRSSPSGSDRTMLISPTRVFYAGLLGKPTNRRFGSVTIYLAAAGTVRVDSAGAVQCSDVAVVRPYLEHRISTAARSIVTIMVEAESISDAATLALSQVACDPLQAAEFASRVREAHARLDTEARDGFRQEEFDALFFGGRLAARPMDRRIADVVALFQGTSEATLSGSACARGANLSLSRFLHLFKSETNATFRAFRAWKRARSLLEHVDQRVNLAHLALDIGYPDSTHFSHSVRRIYGLRPSAIFSGSRRLRVVRSAGVACSARRM